MKEFNYLGYVFKRNGGGQESHIRHRMRKAEIVMNGVWGIGKENLEKIGVGECGCSTPWCEQ